MIFSKSSIPEEVQRLFTLLGNKNLRFVGGCVRNALLGLPITDIDLATTLRPEEVMRTLKAAHIQCIPTGIDYGTVTAVLNGVGYQITTLRRDVATDGRRAVVAYTTDWAEDAARRDLTVNALYADWNGMIYDPLGEGLKDIEKRRIRFVGDPEVRIQEDYLRILRFLRFYSFYGAGPIDQRGLSASIKFSHKIKTLSRERVSDEFRKILIGPNPEKVLKLMRDHRILPEIISNNFNPKRIGSELKFENHVTILDTEVVFAVRLFIVANFSTKRIRNLSNHLIISKKLNQILKDISTIKINTKRIEMLKMMEYVYFYPRDSVAAALILWAVNSEMSLSEFKKIWRNFITLEPPVFPISGKDLIAEGIAQDIAIGEKLKALEKKWIKSGFRLTRSELLDLD
ncbi:MAG: CCA tRNA nucleotidyltransferase [Alphaproteobacteria bacterium]|nr:CCA tRNA nucleotidyltransferase [Alphaproteobacteria bacterium]